MKVKIIATNEIVDGDPIELNFIRVGDRFLSPDEYQLVFQCDSCDFISSDGEECGVHEAENAGHFCDFPN